MEKKLLFPDEKIEDIEVLVIFQSDALQLEFWAVLECLLSVERDCVAGGEDGEGESEDDAGPFLDGEGHMQLPLGRVSVLVIVVFGGGGGLDLVIPKIFNLEIVF